MQPMKWMSFMLVLCIMLTMSTAVADEENVYEIDPQIGLAESVDASTGLTVEGVDAPVFTEILEDEAFAVEASYAAAQSSDQADASASGMRFAAVIADGTPVYIRPNDWDVTALLGAGDVVLVTAYDGSRAAVSFNAGGVALSGYMEPGDIALLDEAQSAAYQSEAAASGPVLLYAGDASLPMASLTDAIWGASLAVMANYTDYSNDTVYTMNGVQICASMVPDTGSGNCWRYAQGVYQLAWGCKFSENFAGNAETGHNLLRELNDAQRKLTPAHIKGFILRTAPGATIRIGGCSSACSSFNNDGLSCGHTGHSLIIAAHNDEGVVTIDSHSNSQHTRFYTWEGFCKAWRDFPYIKYIKWPGAGAISPSEISEDGSVEIGVNGVSLSQTELELNVGGTATLSAVVTPESATQKGVVWASSDESVATVSEGVVTGVREGSATIGVRTTDGGFEAYCAVTVSRPKAMKALTKKGSNGTVTLGVGEQLQLTADFAVANGWTLAGVKSSKSKYATISETGLITAVAEGKTKITVYTTNKKKATLKVKVVDPYKPQKIALNKSGTIKLKAGDTLKLQYAILPTTARTSVLWKSSNEKVATVDQEGNVTTHGKGKCYIGVMTANGKLAKVKLKVSK